MSEHFDLLVLGAGPAGEKGAAQAAYFGKRVAIVERAPKPGGTVANEGTISARALRETALQFAALRRRTLSGVDFTIRPDLGPDDFMHRERGVVEGEWARVEDNLRRHAITSIRGEARLVASNAVEVKRYREEPRLVTAEHVLVATGAAPDRPAHLPFDGRVVVDYEEVLRLGTIPPRMVVLGGGTLATEYASTFAALGTRVTIVHARPRLVAEYDAAISEALETALTRRLGIMVRSDATVVATTVDDGIARVTLLDGSVLAAECVLVCAGRRGRTEGLGLEEVGVVLNDRGFVRVDDRFRTAAPGVLAAGDVVGSPFLASVAMEQARVAVCHAFDLRYKQRLAAVLPHVVWSIPEVAMVGETEESARARRLDHEIGVAPFRGNARGRIIGEVDGFVKLVFRPADQRLLGASVVGEGAAELIHTAMTCLLHEGTIDFFIQAVFNYPTLGEAWKYAAYDGLQRAAKRLEPVVGGRR